MYSVQALLAEGFPHSDIRGSTIARISPRLFAACHVLHRLLAPRHPPNALVSLTIKTPIRPHAVPNRATNFFSAGQQALRSLSLYTTIPRFTCQRSTLARTSLSRGGSLGSGHSWGPEVPAEASRCPTARRQSLQDIERGERSQTIWQVVIVSGRSQPEDIRPQRHALSLKGGDPAAGSPTATLLRLHPSH